MFSILASKSKASKDACSPHPKDVVLDKLLHGYVQKLKSTVCLLLAQEISHLSHRDGPCHEDNSLNSENERLFSISLTHVQHAYECVCVCGVFVCMYVCVFAFVCIYVCVLMYVYMGVLCICMCVFMNIQMGACVWICMFVCMYACVSCKSRSDSYTIRT